jgi:hypothetical protein
MAADDPRQSPFILRVPDRVLLSEGTRIFDSLDGREIGIASLGIGLSL